MRHVWGLLLVVVFLGGCSTPQTLPTEQLFPASVGDFFRVAGPFAEPETGAEFASYAGPTGEVTLYARFVGQEEVPYALSELPSGSLDVGYQEELGQRDGVVFTYALEYHAAWGNGDWVFVLKAPTPEARRTFLAGYGF